MDLGDFKTKDGVSIVDLLGQRLQVDGPPGEDGQPQRVDLDHAQLMITLDPPVVKVTGAVMPADGTKISPKNGRSAGKFGTFDPGQVYANRE